LYKEHKKKKWGPTFDEPEGGGNIASGRGKVQAEATKRALIAANRQKEPRDEGRQTPRRLGGQKGCKKGKLGG